MDIAAAITLGIAIAGFIGGIIIKTADLSRKYGALTQKVDQNTDRAKEERDHASDKFKELYNKTTAHESSIKELGGKVDTLMLSCQRIESKLDRLIEREVDK